MISLGGLLFSEEKLRKINLGKKGGMCWWMSERRRGRGNCSQDVTYERITVTIKIVYNEEE